MKRREFIKSACSATGAAMLTGCVSCGVATLQETVERETKRTIVRVNAPVLLTR